jgi:biopolymer transport protein ExbD
MVAASGSENMELNLTPLLDVVMQLVMFFLMCMNFVTDQVNQNVLLPKSASAQEIMAKTDVDVLVINIEVRRAEKMDANGRPVRDPATGALVRELVLPKETKIVFTGLEEVPYFKDANEGAAIAKAQTYLARYAKLYKQKEANRQGKPVDQVAMKTVVVIRADEETRYGLVVQLIAQCNKEGFARVELRAQSEG